MAAKNRCPTTEPLWFTAPHERLQPTPADPHTDPVADLLAFAPVPRKTERVDGWTAERQRAFIEALALSGSPRRAAAAVGKAQWGAKQLRKAPGADGFNAAWEAAMAWSRSEDSRRIRAGVGLARGEAEAWHPTPGPWSDTRSRAHAGSPAPEAEDGPEDRRAWLDWILRKYLLKVQSDRNARLEGRVVEADFYLRQITWLEVVLDLLGDGALPLLADFRREGHSLIDIAETPISRILGAARRQVWAGTGEPARPEHPPRDRLVDHGRFSSQPGETAKGGGSWSGITDQWRAFDEQHARDAIEQVRWEAQQRQAEPRDQRADCEAIGELGGDGANQVLSLSKGMPAPAFRAWMERHAPPSSTPPKSVLSLP